MDIVHAFASKKGPAALPPTALRPQDVEEFRRILSENGQEDLTELEAWNRAIELMALVRMLHSPLPEDPED